MISQIVQDMLELVRMSFLWLENKLLQFANLESVIFISKLECKRKKAKEEEIKKYVIQLITKCFYCVCFTNELHRVKENWYILNTIKLIL